MTTIRRATLSLVLGTTFALASAPAALASTSESTNWSGYAVHRSGVTFAKVLGSWTQPAGACTPGNTGYSSIWVGIGGYSANSSALEQVGTELDCSATGAAVSSAWYELVPAASQTTRLKIDPGDRIRASVVISGRIVRLTLTDLTRRRGFTKVLHASALDQTSAEWIVEAPSICNGGNNCQTLPLADFGSARFTGALTTSTTGHAGTISDRRWGSTRIQLVEGGTRFVGGGSGGGTATGAVASPLTSGGSSFSVTYSGSSSTTTTGGSSDHSKPPSSTHRLVRPGRRLTPIS
jgi:Peptidase A4 family